MNLTIADVRLTPILVADPPLLNTQGVHQPYTPRLIVEVETSTEAPSGGGLASCSQIFGNGTPSRSHWSRRARTGAGKLPRMWFERGIKAFIESAISARLVVLLGFLHG